MVDRDELELALRIIHERRARGGAPDLGAAIEERIMARLRELDGASSGNGSPTARATKGCQ